MNVLPKDFTAQENLIAQALDEMGLRYEEQYPVYNYLLDFYIPEIKMAIEADGKYGHLRKRDVKRDIKVSNSPDVEYILHVRAFTKKTVKEILWQGLNKLLKV